MPLTQKQDRRKQFSSLLMPVIGLLAAGFAAWYGLRERVTAAEIRIDSLPERMAEVEARVLVIESQQAAAGEMLQEIRADIKTLLRETGR